MGRRPALPDLPAVHSAILVLHASIGITLDTYSHVLPTLQQEAAEAFDRIFATESEGAGKR